MSAVDTSLHGRPGNFGPHVEPGEIRATVTAPIAPLSGDELYPGEAAASLLPPPETCPAAIAPLTRFLGPMLTVASPAWSVDPVPRMRSLQKTLVEQSLTLDPADRRVCLDAISVVEKAVRLRLRLQQMRMSELEMNIKPQVKAAAA